MKKTLLIPKFRSKLLILLLFTTISYSQNSTKVLFVNDTSLKGDIYCTAIGNDANDGISSQKPKLTLKAAYELAETGAVIYVDTGIYAEDATKEKLTFENTKNIRIVFSNASNESTSRSPLPKDEKNSPEEFYIINDKPVTHDVYLKYISQNANKQ